MTRRAFLLGGAVGVGFVSAQEVEERAMWADLMEFKVRWDGWTEELGKGKYDVKRATKLRDQWGKVKKWLPV